MTDTPKKETLEEEPGASPTGHPAETPPEATPEADPQTYEVGGREFTSIEDALAYSNELAKHAGQQANEIGELRTKVSTLEVSSQETMEREPVEASPYSEIFYDDVDAALNKVKEDAKREAKEEMDAERLQKESRDAIWTNFYEANPELKGHELVVQGVYVSQYDDLAGLKTVDALEKIATDSKAYLKRNEIELGRKGAEPVDTGAARVEGSSDVLTEKAKVPKAKMTTFSEELSEFQKTKVKGG